MTTPFKVVIIRNAGDGARRCGGTGRRKGLKIPRWKHCTGSIPVNGTITILYRGVEQLVARRAHNPEVVWFKSHPRNQKNSQVERLGIFFWNDVCPDGQMMSASPNDVAFGRDACLWAHKGKQRIIAARSSATSF